MCSGILFLSQFLFPWWNIIWSSFSYVYLSSACLCCWGVYLGLGPIFKSGSLFFSLLNFKSSLTLTILYQMYFLQIFTPSLWFVLILPFTEHKVLHFNDAQFMNYLFYRFYICCCILKVITISNWVFPMLSSRSFMVLHFTFKSDHFELIFVKSVRYNWILLFACGWAVAQTPFVENTIFVWCIIYAFVLRIRWPYLRLSISGHAILFHWSICLLYHQHHTVLTPCRFTVRIEVRKCQFSNFVST